MRLAVTLLLVPLLAGAAAQRPRHHVMQRLADGVFADWTAWELRFRVIRHPDFAAPSALLARVETRRAAESEVPRRASQIVALLPFAPKTPIVAGQERDRWAKAAAQAAVADEPFYLSDGSTVMSAHVPITALIVAAPVSDGCATIGVALPHRTDLALSRRVAIGKAEPFESAPRWRYTRSVQDARIVAAPCRVIVVHGSQRRGEPLVLRVRDKDREAVDAAARVGRFIGVVP